MPKAGVDDAKIMTTSCFGKDQWIGFVGKIYRKPHIYWENPWFP